MEPTLTRNLEDRHLIYDTNKTLEEHNRKIERMGEYLFRERHVKLEREGEVGYLEEILDEKEE